VLVPHSKKPKQTTKKSQHQTNCLSKRHLYFFDTFYTYDVKQGVYLLNFEAFGNNKA